MTTTSRIFDETERTDASTRRHGESIATFLNRAAGETWNAVRGLIDDWLAHVPSDAADLVGRLRDTDDSQFLSAFWELYFHETLVRSGFDIVIHPALEGTSRRPDFLVRRAGLEFYLEARVVRPDGVEAGSDARVRSMYEQLNKVDSPNVALWPQVRKEGWRGSADKDAGQAAGQMVGDA